MVDGWVAKAQLISFGRLLNTEEVSFGFEKECCDSVLIDDTYVGKQKHITTDYFT